MAGTDGPGQASNREDISAWPSTRTCRTSSPKKWTRLSNRTEVTCPGKRVFPVFPKYVYIYILNQESETHTLYDSIFDNINVGSFQGG